MVVRQGTSVTCVFHIFCLLEQQKIDYYVIYIIIYLFIYSANSLGALVVEVVFRWNCRKEKAVLEMHLSTERGAYVSIWQCLYRQAWIIGVL
jgi:hypothetical protein